MPGEWEVECYGSSAERKVTRYWMSYYDYVDQVTYQRTEGQQRLCQVQ